MKTKTQQAATRTVDYCTFCSLYHLDPTHDTEEKSKKIIMLSGGQIKRTKLCKKAITAMGEEPPEAATYNYKIVSKEESSQMWRRKQKKKCDGPEDSQKE